MKKGRHRRFEEARALKRNQDLDLDSIFDSLDNTREGSSKSGESTAFDAWADDFDDARGLLSISTTLWGIA